MIAIGDVLQHCSLEVVRKDMMFNARTAAAFGPLLWLHLGWS